MFQDGSAEKAMELYTSLFPASRIESIERYGDEEPERVGTVKVASFTLNGHALMCIDSPPVHAFNFTPSVSLFVNVADEQEFEKVFNTLSMEGQVLMPPDNYGFSKRYAWVNDRFGVSWQVSIP